jgi:hypothetical protein
MTDYSSISDDEIYLALAAKHAPTPEQTDEDLIRATAERMNMETGIDKVQDWYRTKLVTAEAERETLRASLSAIATKLTERKPGTIRELKKQMKNGINRLERICSAIDHYQVMSVRRHAVVNRI